VTGILGGVKAGAVVRVRHEGPRGAPGMQEMLSPTSYLKAEVLGEALRSGDGRPVLQRLVGPLDRTLFAQGGERRVDRPGRGRRNYRDRHSRTVVVPGRARCRFGRKPHRHGGDGRRRLAAAGTAPAPRRSNHQGGSGSRLLISPGTASSAALEFEQPSKQTGTAREPSRPIPADGVIGRLDQDTRESALIRVLASRPADRFAPDRLSDDVWAPGGRVAHDRDAHTRVP
jgi:hypothetical protein